MSPAHLIQHVKLVGEAAEILILQLQQLDLAIDRDYWEMFITLNNGFEEIAATGAARLSRSLVESD